MPPQDQSYARQQLLRWLETSVGEQPLALAVLSLKEFKVVHDFTTDSQVLVAALKKVRSRPMELASSETGYATGLNASATKEEAGLLELLHGKGDQISTGKKTTSRSDGESSP